MHLKLVNRLLYTSNIILRGRKMSSYKEIKVQIEQGVIIGKQNTPKNGNSFNSFLGIPYAVPPLGNLRFKSPVPLKRFDVDELKCLEEKSVSFQKDPFSLEIVGSEDCLYLNVYSPQSSSKKGPLPVMVWIHGGGFLFGNGNSDYTLPRLFMDEDVIMVTLTYRLGAFGFLSFPEEGVWGNAGLKDQRLALQWVQDNIAKFGGNPNNVTIFGESAGAASVHLHTYAAHANKLFHKAITQSGTGNMEWVFQENPSYKTRLLCELLGGKCEKSAEVIKFLRSDETTPLKVLAATMSVLTVDERRRLPLPFKPVLENPSSPDSFITRPIRELLHEPNTCRIPTIMGYNSAEGIAMLVSAIRKIPDFDQDLARLVPRDLPFKISNPDIEKIADKIRNFYFQGEKISSALLDNFVDLFSDFHFVIDVQKAAEYQSRYQHNAPLYFYRFDYVGHRNLFKKIFDLEQCRGAAHGDELFYMFQMKGLAEKLDEEDYLMAKRLCQLWANFARTGQPTPNGIESPIINGIWEPVQKLTKEEQQFNLDYYVIDKNCKMQKNPDKERMDFWNDIYQHYITTDYSIRSRAKL